MKIALIFAAIAATTAAAAPLPKAEIGRMADAIYRAEGGSKARVPYGVLSVRVANAAEARRVCERSIVNNYARWQKAGKPGDFIGFMGDRWCPASADPRGNVNWKNNVRKIYGKEVK